MEKDAKIHDLKQKLDCEIKEKESLRDEIEKLRAIDGDEPPAKRKRQQQVS